MEKKAYVKPVMESETFVPQTYIAACGDENKVYKFVCDAGGGTPGTVYEDSNHNGKWDLLDDKALTGYIIPTYHACGQTHEAPTDDEFINGFYLPNSNPFNIKKVIIWTDGGTNVHCTTNLDMATWETDKS